MGFEYTDRSKDKKLIYSALAIQELMSYIDMHYDCKLIATKCFIIIHL